MTPGHRNFAFNVTSNSLFGVVVQTTATHRDTAATSSANTLAGLSQADGKEHRNLGVITFGYRPPTFVRTCACHYIYTLFSLPQLLFYFGVAKCRNKATT